MTYWELKLFSSIKIPFITMIYEYKVLSVIVYENEV